MGAEKWKGSRASSSMVNEVDLDMPGPGLTTSETRLGVKSQE
jgi:hypothetical protein